MGVFAGSCYSAFAAGKACRYGLIVFLVSKRTKPGVVLQRRSAKRSVLFSRRCCIPWWFRGRARRLLTAAIALDLCALLVVEAQFPQLLVPFCHVERTDALDSITGALCSCLAVAAIMRLVMSAYERERERLSATAAQLASSEHNLREMFDATSEALAIRDREGRFIRRRRADVRDVWRRAVPRSTGSRSTVPQPSGRVRVQKPNRRKEHSRPWNRGRRCLCGGAGGRTEELFGRSVRAGGGEMGGEQRLISATRDISGRVQAAEALRVEEERLRLALEASNQGWFDIDVQTRVGRASAEYARIIGREAVDYAVSAQSGSAGRACR